MLTRLKDGKRKEALVCSQITFLLHFLRRLHVESRRSLVLMKKMAFWTAIQRKKRKKDNKEEIQAHWHTPLHATPIRKNVLKTDKCVVCDEE